MSASPDVINVTCTLDELGPSSKYGSVLQPPPVGTPVQWGPTGQPIRRFLAR